MKFKALCTVLVLAAATASCGAVSRIWTSLTGDLTYKCSKHGIGYVQSDSGIAVSIGANGSPASCNE